MLLNEILDELQLTHKKNPNLSAGTYAATSEGAASIDQLGLVSLGLYSRYLGLGIDQATINVIGDNKKYARRNRLVRCDDSDHGNDASTADYALVCDLLQEGFSYADAEIIIRATRYREKFDEMRGKTTYLERTLDRAIESVEGSRNSMAADLPVISHERGRINANAELVIHPVVGKKLQDVSRNERNAIALLDADGLPVVVVVVVVHRACSRIDKSATGVCDLGWRRACKGNAGM